MRRSPAAKTANYGAKEELRQSVTVSPSGEVLSLLRARVFRQWKLLVSIAVTFLLVWAVTVGLLFLSGHKITAPWLAYFVSLMPLLALLPLMILFGPLLAFMGTMCVVWAVSGVLLVFGLLLSLLLVLPHGPAVSVAALFVDLAVEPTPPGTWELTQLKPEGWAEAGARGFMHSSVYEDSYALQVIGAWILREQ